MEDRILSAMLSSLNQQLFNCVQSGARFKPHFRFDCVSGGDREQNAYYQGHFNMAESLAMSIDPANYIDVDENGKHSMKRYNWSVEV